MRRSLRRHACCGSVGAMLLLLAGPAHASTILFSNFGPGNTFQTSTATSWADGSAADSSNAVSLVNSSPSAFRLDDFRFADNWFAGTNMLLVGFWGGSTDLNTATLLESFTFTAAALQAPQIFTAISLLHPLIEPGGTYFITQSVPGAPATTWGWQWNNQGQTGFFAKFDGGAWFAEGVETPVFDVSGTLVTPASVPEPATLALVGCGLALVAYQRRRALRGRRVCRAIRAAAFFTSVQSSRQAVRRVFVAFVVSACSATRSEECCRESRLVACPAWPPP